MPLVKVLVRRSPCAAIRPMTLDRVGGEAGSETEDLKKVEDLSDAFRQFQPKLKFQGYAGPEQAEFRAEFDFRSIKDFDPENLQKRQEVKDADGDQH